MSESKPKSRRWAAAAVLAALLVAASAALAIVMSLTPPPRERLAEVRRLLAEGRIEAALAALDGISADDPSLSAEVSALRSRIEASRRRGVEQRWQEDALTRARKAADRGDLAAAARALERAGGEDRELCEEVSRELAVRAKKAAEEWDLEEAKRLVDLAGRAWRESAEVAGAEMEVTARAQQAERVQALLDTAREAKARGDWVAAARALEEADGIRAPPDLMGQVDELLEEVSARAKLERDRQATLDKVAALLDEGKVAQARRVLETYAKESGDHSLDAQVDALRDLEKQGGTDAFLPARRALRWLADHQDPKDGGFKCAGYAEVCGKPECKTAGAHPVYDPGVSGLALMAFTAFRDLDILGEFREPADRCATYLVGLVDKNGDVPSFTYNDAIVTLALLERARAIGKAEAEIAAATRAVTHICTKLRLQDGGWRYGATGLSDVSVTCWVMQALDAARQAAVPVPEGVIEGGLAYLDSMTDTAGNTGYYQFARTGLPNMTAAALLARLFFRTPQTDTKIPASRNALLSRLDRVMRLAKKPKQAAALLPKIWNDLYGWYYATYALKKLGGKEWDSWGPIVETALSTSQVVKGHALGSWTYGGRGGRLYATSLNALTLEAYYRHKATGGAK